MVKQINQWLPLYISGKDIQTKPHHVCDLIPVWWFLCDVWWISNYHKSSL